MRGLFNPDSRLMRALSFLGDMMLLNLVFILSCLPVFTAGASAAALYTVALRMVRDEQSGIVGPFFRAFLDNFKKATVIWIGIALIGAVLFFGFQVLNANPGVFPFFVTVIYYLMAFFLLMTAGWVFAVTARFENSIRNTVKNAFLLGLLHLPRTIVIMLFTALIPAVFVIAPYFFLSASVVWVMFGFSGAALLNSLLIRPVFDRLSENPEE